MTTVYGVMCGQYSDKYMDAIFTLEDAAYEYAYENDGYVQELTLDPTYTAKRKLQPGERLYSVDMQLDGGRATAELIAWASKEKTLVREDKVSRIVTICFARSPEQAIKIANDKRTSWLSTGKRTVTNPENIYWRIAEVD